MKSAIPVALATLDAIKNVAVGMSPVIPGDGRYGIASVTPAELTAILANGISGARIERIRLDAGTKGTTDRGRLLLDWNQAGRDAGLPASAFAKGTPSTTSSRILNATFGLCESEVRFYNELHADVAPLTLRPYLARVGAGGRFAIALEDLGDEATFFQPGDAPPLSHAEAMMDILALLHARYWRSPRFERDLRWITPYSRRPGFPLANPVLVKYERSWLRNKSDAPLAVRRLTRFFVENRLHIDRAWEALPPTLVHGDPHLGNTYARNDGRSGLYDWQNIHKMNGMRDVAYFIGHALPVELRRAQERELLKRYLDGLASRGVGAEVPSFEAAFDLYRLLMVDCWTSIWAPLAIGGMLSEQWRADTLLQRLYAALVDLDTEKALLAVG